MKRNRFATPLVWLISVVLWSSAVAAPQSRPPTASLAPHDVLGFDPGDDRKLASWAQIVEYFQKLDTASDRVLVQELGRTTLDRPFLLATISAPENLRQLDRYRDIQRRLADPRTISSGADAERLIAEGKTVVLVTFGVHSTEVGSTLSSTLVAHRLASDDSPDGREILQNCIVLLVPSLNPDGVDIVNNWYRRTLGTPYEGSGPPELYHHYVGHDNNRDWYAFTQVETQLTVDKVHNAWHPQIVHDVHQMGSFGSRLFVPPYIDPVEPNVDPLIVQGVNFMGTAMAWELTAQGLPGIVLNGIYDAWTPARAYQHYHGGIRILSETASARLATPIAIRFDQLQLGRNYDPKTSSWNFPMPWRGGQWRLRDIVTYQTSGVFALMRNAARYRDRWLRNFYLIGQRAIAPGEGKPFAFLLLEEGSNPDGYARLVQILLRGAVEIHRAQQPFQADGTTYPAGTLVIPLAQPYGSFAKTLLEVQQYPDLREYPGGPPKQPYDVTAHTLPLLMNVRAVAVHRAFPADLRRIEQPPPLEQRLKPASAARLGLYKSYAASMDEGWTRWILDQYRIPYTSLHDAEIRAGNLRAKFAVILFPDQSPAPIVRGLSTSAYPAEYAGGLSAAGLAELRKFVQSGGRLVALNGASDFAIETFDLPVRNVLRGLSAKEFYCPGSILKLALNASHPLAKGMPVDTIAWFEDGGAYELTESGGSSVRVIARYGEGDPLLSGWILGPNYVTGKAAIVEANVGDGAVVLFGFRPQYRGQSVATFPLFFNAATSLP
jgi:hypothetical protein